MSGWGAWSSALNWLMGGEGLLPPGVVAMVSSRNGVRSPGADRKVPDEAKIHEIVRRIVEAVAPEKIILFGSAARGEMGANSDLDFLVVKQCEDRTQVAQAIYRNLRGVRVPKDVVVVTPEDVERHKGTIGFVIRPALQEGIVVYGA